MHMHMHARAESKDHVAPVERAILTLPTADVVCNKDIPSTLNHNPIVLRP
jgi:hypothetical protein